MATVIGQKWKIYDFNEMRDQGVILELGEVIKVINTPDFDAEIVTLTGDGTRNIEAIYEVYMKQIRGQIPLHPFANLSFF